MNNLKIACAVAFTVGLNLTALQMLLTIFP